MNDEELLGFHRQLVGIRSLSHEEEEVCEFLREFLAGRGVSVERLGRNIFARAGVGPRLLLNSHYDTVPPGPEWTRNPWQVSVEDGHVYGLGSNDAKASVAAMVATLLSVAASGGPCEVGLLIACEEETGGEGSEWAWPRCRERFDPEAVIVGEPTGLHIAIAQKGLLILELTGHGSGGHAANAIATHATSAIRSVARDLVAIEQVTLGDPHPLLGCTTVEPTEISGGEARNKVAERTSCILDVRSVPGFEHESIVKQLRAHVSGELRVCSDRLEPIGCSPEAPVVIAAQKARGASVTFGSRTMSDLVFFKGVDGIKVGPGQTERSHQPDEFVLETEIIEGAAFYRSLIKSFAIERTRS